MVTINKLRNRFQGLQKESILVLSKLLNQDKSYIYAYGDREVSVEIEEEYLNIMEKLEKDYPIQYILKEEEFMGLNFYVDEGVLIPRYDTEVLVEYIINYIETNYKNENINILDIGTGSGAIALSIAHYCRNARLYAVDIEDKAIEIAEINKNRFNLSNVKILKSNLFDKIDEKFEIIVSNPPYISKEEIEKLDSKVKDFEPRIALDGGCDGLDYYREISRKSKEYLKAGGLLIYEIGYDQGELVKNILFDENFKGIDILKDLQGHNRVVLGFNRN